MSSEILVNVAPDETRVALVEAGAAQEVIVQRASRHGLVGNIYKGRVERVLPGMQAAFVDIGLERTAFLHVADMAAIDESEQRERPIDQRLQEGQPILVQILKDPLGSKGARLTTMLSIPARYLVLLPFEPHSGISVRIEDEAERLRLKSLVESLTAEVCPQYGVIARTAAEGVDEEEMRVDLTFLTRIWQAIRDKAAHSPPGSLVHADLPLSMRILRDLLSEDVERVRIDNPDEFERVRAFAETFVPRAVARLELYQGHAPLFDLFGVEDDIERALARKVELKSGGHLVIDQTEAMTTIDVNTGAFTGHRNVEETVLKTNLDAAQAMARQLRLRNLGGIIILDFIDMKSEDHRAQVLRALQKELKRDSARTQIYPISPLGLVEMTRKRTRESLGHILCEPCPYCDGRGSIKTVETVCHEIAREIQRSARQFEAKSFLVLAAPAVTQRLMDDQSIGLAELETQLDRPIRLQSEAAYERESFDVVPL